MGAGGGSLIVLSLLLLRKKKPYGTISHGVVEVRGTDIAVGGAVSSELAPAPSVPSLPLCPEPSLGPIAGGPHVDPGGAATPGTSAAWL